MFNMCKTFNVLPNIFVLGEIKTVAMFNYSFFEKLAQSYFCDGVIHVSAGSSWIQFFFSATEMRKQNFSLRDDLNYSKQLCFIQTPQNPVGCQT